MIDPRRQLLLEVYAAASRINDRDSEESALALATRAALRCGLSVGLLDEEVLDGSGSGHPGRLAIRVSHSLEFGHTGVTLWSGGLQACGDDAPTQYLALAAARLLAGSDDLLLLIGNLYGCGGPGTHTVALVDGETCARITVAGLDLEAAFAGAGAGACAAALAAAGDLLPAPEPRGVSIAGRDAMIPAPASLAPCLLVGLKASAAHVTRLQCERGRPQPHVL